MPVYQIYHAVPLTAEQQQELASTITEIHSSTFTSLTALVNVDYVNVTGKPTFIGGHARASPSTIMASVRTGPSRTIDQFERLAEDLQKAWDKIVRGGDSSMGKGQARVFITGSFITGIEGGYQIPRAGDDAKWLTENLETIKKEAANGHEESIDLLESIDVMQRQHGSVNVG